MKLSHIALIALLGTSVALPGYAQPGPGGGPGAGPGAGMGLGPGRGPAAKAPRFEFNRDNTYGWKLMSAAAECLRPHEGARFVEVRRHRSRTAPWLRAVFLLLHRGAAATASDG